MIHIKKLLLAFLLYLNITSCFALDSDSWKSKKFDVFGVGLSTVNTAYKISDEEFKRLLGIPYGLEKGQMINIDLTTLKYLESKLESLSTYPGGSAANIIANLASFGAITSYNSIVSDDNFGRLFVQSMYDSGVISCSAPKYGHGDTSRGLLFITPDGERTILSYSGITEDMNQLDVRYHEVKDYKVVLVEAGIWDKGGGRSKTALRAFNSAEKVGAKKAFSLHDVLFINKHKDDLLQLLENVDIVFGNEKEAKALFSTNKFEDVINGFHKLNIEIAVITMGAKGAVIITQNDLIKIPPADIAKNEIIDKSGSGDGFAAGFLYGYTHGMTLKEAGMLGAKASRVILTQIGTRANISLSSLL